MGLGREWLNIQRGLGRHRSSLWSLHGLLVLLVPAGLLAWLLALLAPLALFVFVSAVAVALLAVVPPPAAAAGEEVRWGGGEGEEVVERGRRRWRE